MRFFKQISIYFKISPTTPCQRDTTKKRQFRFRNYRFDSATTLLLATWLLLLNTTDSWSSNPSATKKCRVTTKSATKKCRITTKSATKKCIVAAFYYWITQIILHFWGISFYIFGHKFWRICGISLGKIVVNTILFDIHKNYIIMNNSRVYAVISIFQRSLVRRSR